MLNHISSVYYSVQIVKSSVFGHGLGVDHVSLISELIEVRSEKFTIKSEGLLAVYSIFFGGVGWVLYTFLVYIVFPRKDQIGLIKLIKYCCLAIVLSSIVAHSAISILGSSHVFLLLGIALGEIDKKYNNLKVK